MFMLYAGLIADRMSRRRLLILTQTAMLVLAFLSAALVFSHAIQPWHILVLAFGFGAANAFDAPARQAMVHELVAPENLTNAIALNSAMFNTSAALGPAVGGILYALIGPAWCFVINGLSFVAVIAALAAMRLVKHVPPPRSASTLADLAEGLGYVRHHDIIRTFIVAVLVTSLFGNSFVTIVPAWAVKVLHGGAATNGFLTSARGLGALLAALLIASLGRFKFRGRLWTLGALALPVFLILFSLVRWQPLAYLAIFASGFALILVLNLANASVQTLTAPHLRGRVMGIYSMAFFGAMPLGSVLIGSLASRFGEPAALMATSAVVLLFMLGVTIARPNIRRLS
ncbi:MAG: MFS transporter, partial [Acidobacteriota bacterium]|nr:MFS transporter [Acidobacteriota bacterium]